MNRTDAQKLSKQTLDDLAAQLEAGKSESLLAFLCAAARFHDYSVGNIFMILAQRPDATRVAGVRTWNRLGRFVRKGEKGIGIFAPVRFKAQEATATGEEEAGRIGFRVVHVFDISQTDGDPLPEPQTVTGDVSGHLADLKRVVTGRGLRLDYADDLGTARGCYFRGTIRLASGMNPAEEFSVLAHELAHSVMHAVHNGFNRDRAELEAEAVACVLCRYAGLDSGTSHSDYIQLYRGGKDSLIESLDAIQGAASELIRELSEKHQALAA